MKLLLAALLAGSSMLAPAAAQNQPAAADAAKPVPVAAFGRLPQIERPRLSADGEMMAAKIAAGGEQVLAVLDLTKADAKPELIARDGQFDKLGDMTVASWTWVSADHLVIWVQERSDSDGYRFDSHFPIAYNRRTKKMTPLGWRDSLMFQPSILWSSNEGKPRIHVARFNSTILNDRRFKPEVIEVDLDTGDARILVKPHAVVRNWYTDANGVVRMGTASDAETGKTRILYRPDEKTPLRTILWDKAERYADPPVPQYFLPDGKTAIVSSSKSGYEALYEIDLETMELGKQIFGIEGYDVGGGIPNVRGDGIDGVAYTRDADEYVWFNPRLKGVQETLEESFGKGAVAIASADDKRERFLLRVGKADQAGGYYFYDSVSGAVKAIGWVNPVLQNRTMNPVRTVRYKARDGKEIPAVLTLPRNRPAKDLALIVLPHGGPWSRDAERWDMWAQPLAELGYAVIQPNFRGSTGFGLEWTKLSDGNWGTAMQDDLVDAVTYLASQGIGDPKRACIFGWSYGGYAAGRAAQRDGNVFRCAIAGAGVHDLPAMVRYDKGYLGKDGATYIGAAADNLKSISATLNASQISIPILIVHGAKDVRVPVDQSRNLVAALKKAGKKEGEDFVYVEQPRNTHHLPLESDRVQLLEEMKKFLDKHNPA